MRKVLAIILALQLILVNGAVYAQEPKQEESINAKISSGDEPRQSLSVEADYRNPASYPLIAEGGYVDYLLGSYNDYQYIYYETVTASEYYSDYMKVQLLYSADEAYSKDSILTIEFFKEENNYLNYAGSTEFNTSGATSGLVNSHIAKADFTNEPYIYMRVGISKSSNDTYYSDTTTFKVSNPFYTSSSSTEVDSYAVISNESTNAGAAQPTGTFNLKEMTYTKDKSLKPDAYQVDVNKPFDLANHKGKVARKNARSISLSYNIGDYKNFWVTNFQNNGDYQINARLAYSGTKANVWVYNNQISDSEAEKLGKEFDQKIHSTVTNYFGLESDVNNDGKINILTYDIQDGFSGSGGYIGGYFWSGDLYNTTASNQSEIFYIDTYPSMGMGSVKDVTGAYETLAHEFQHMVNFNRNVLIEGSSSNMDTWLNEGLSMAAEQIYSGKGLSDRVDYFNVSNSIANGHSLLYWDNNGDTLANYSLSYLFGQYIKLQANQGDAVFKEILNDSSNNYQAVENVAKKYISPDMTFGELMTNFRIALLLKESTGLYGFKGDPFFNALEEKIYTGSSANLRGGGAVVTTFDSKEGLSIPANKGSDVTYTTFPMNSGGTEVDVTAPESPVVNPVSDADTQLTGTAEAESKVEAKVNGAVIGSATAGPDGKVTVGITVQKAGTEIVVTAADKAGNVSTAKKVVVEDGTAPGQPTVGVVTDQDITVTGQAEAGSKVEVKVNGALIGSATADVDGEFTANIPVQKAGIELVVTAIDKAGNASAATKVVVKDVTAPGKPSVNGVSEKDTSVTGDAEVGSKVEVKVSGSIIGSGTTGSDGKFTVSIPVQKSGTKLVITAADSGGNVSEGVTVTVKDATLPEAPKVDELTNRETFLIGSAEPSSTIVAKVSGDEIGRGTADSNGKFKVAIPKQSSGKVVEVYVVDNAGSVSPATKVTVNKKLVSLVGETRYATAVKVSQTGWKTADTVLLVNGFAIVDGLTATPLASAKDAPILLTAADSIPKTTMDEITRLKAKEIILIGGDLVITPKVEKELVSKGYKVTRIGGSNRKDTSLVIAKELDKLVDVSTVYVAYGWGEPDALSIAAQAGLKKQPIILADKSAVPADTFAWLKSENITYAYFIGGESVIGPSILSEMDKITSANVLANRLSGVNRHDTNAKVISKFYPEAELRSILVAKSETESLVDALAAGPLAAKLGSPVLLVSSPYGILASQKQALGGKQAKYIHQIGGGVNPSAVGELVK